LGDISLSIAEIRTMKTMQHTVKSCRLIQISEDEALAVGGLLAKVFPKPDKGPVERAVQLKRIGQDYDGPAEHGPVSHIILQEEKVVAHAVTFGRTIGTSAGDLTVMALAYVATDPDCRGQGLGAAVTHAAFSRVDEGVFPCALFQTSFKVQPFYEQIGCKLVENRIYNSLNEEDPSANPFWDNVVMRYPAAEGWPTGDIDLRGRGY
jgi:GNAT superfamily N-acetyltransferase